MFAAVASILSALLGLLTPAPASPGCRWTGLTDHHFLHYFVTLATSLHVCYILATVTP